MEISRAEPSYRPEQERISDFSWVEVPLSREEVVRQANRCMDCGVPFCHAFGCPLGNRVPDYVDAVYREAWREALEILHETNNFPEFTGRICPALCEASCTLSLYSDPTICRHIEMQIAETGWENGWIVPEPAVWSTGCRAAVIGSGPSGLAAAQQLARKGHAVTVFEKSDRLGGILRYGIPNFKLEKQILDRRLDQLSGEGIVFETDTEIGVDISARYLKKNFNAVIIASGTQKPRDLPVPGRELKGVHFAMEFLTQQTKLLYGDSISEEEIIEPKGKHVVVIGGGDTGSDCVGTCIRRGAASVTQIELLPQPSAERQKNNPWPEWPQILRTSSSHKEGCQRMWSVLTKEMYGDAEGNVNKIGCARLQHDGKTFKEIPGSDFLLDADLVLLSMGFVPDSESILVREFALETDDRGNIINDGSYMTSSEGIFITGDAASGPSLVVRAIHHGRQAAERVDEFLS